MQYINIYEAKTHLSKYLEQVSTSHGEIVICKNGKPIAKLIKYEPKPTRKLGLGKNTIRIAADFDVLPPDFLDYFS